MIQWKWADPAFLYWLLGVPLLAYLIVFFGRRKFQILQKTVGEKVLPYLLSGISMRKHKIKILLSMLALIPLIGALARPQFGETKENVKSMGIELMILFDVSQSMLAEDVSPSRLQMAKHEVNRLLDKIPGSKIGLIAFAGSAALISPITTDASAMKMFVESLTTDAIATQGTEFKMALEQAEAAFARGGAGEDPDVKVTRVILIVSDGEDQEPGALETAEKLTEKGIRIFGVSVGTEAGGQIPLRDANGFLRGYKTDSQGQPVITKSKGEVLKGLAQSGKGSYYSATFGGPYIDQLVEDFNKLEKVEFDSKVQVSYQERFQIFVLIGILMLMFEMALNTRRQTDQKWRGRFQAD